MENYNIGITLTNLKGTRLTNTQSGRRVICIDVNECPEVTEKDGKVYLNLSAVATREVRYGSTHIILGQKDPNAPQGTKGVILGNLKPFQPRNDQPQQNGGYNNGGQSWQQQQQQKSDLPW